MISVNVLSVNCAALAPVKHPAIIAERKMFVFIRLLR